MLPIISNSTLVCTLLASDLFGLEMHPVGELIGVAKLLRPTLLESLPTSSTLHKSYDSLC